MYYSLETSLLVLIGKITTMLMLIFLQLTHPTAINIALKVADAVNYMHSHNPIVIHQDLKPQNVLVSYKCRVLVTQL